MKSIVYVPQGCSANLITASSSYNIAGLYTDGFSTCNIIVCIGKERMALIHADVFTNPIKIKEEIEWVGGPQELIIIKRAEGEHLLQELKRFFKEHMPQTKFSVKQIDNQHDGILVSFQQQPGSDLHPQIKKCPIYQRPENLIHHPDEQKFLAVQKIEQLIGTRARAKTGKSRLKQCYIFDGSAWEPLEEWHFSVDVSHELTKEEIGFFNKADPYIVLGGKLAGLVEGSKKTVPILGETKELAMSVVPYLEAYLNNYDYELLFKRNLEELLNAPQPVAGYVPMSSEDKKLKEDILHLLKKPLSNLEGITRLIDSYKQAAPQTEFKDNILDEVKTFSQHYHERKYYQDLHIQYNQRIAAAKKLAAKAIQAYSAKKYAAAANLFLEAIGEYACCRTKAEPDFATAYYNLGRSLHQQGQFEEAVFFLEKCLSYKENYVQPRPSAADLEKTAKALNESKQKFQENRPNIENAKKLNFSHTT